MFLTFLGTWLTTSLALGLAVVTLTFVFRGTFIEGGWKREGCIVIVTAFFHALVITAALSIQEDLPRGVGAAVFFSLAITYLVYKMTHLQDLTNPEIASLTITNFGYLVIAEFVLLD